MGDTKGTDTDRSDRPLELWTQIQSENCATLELAHYGLILPLHTTVLLRRLPFPPPTVLESRSATSSCRMSSPVCGVAVSLCHPSLY